MGRVPAVGAVTEVLAIAHGEHDPTFAVDDDEPEIGDCEQPLEQGDARGQAAGLDPVDGGPGHLGSLRELPLAQVGDPAQPADETRERDVSQASTRDRLVLGRPPGILRVDFYGCHAWDLPAR
jgi:hypothetical protein